MVMSKCHSKCAMTSRTEGYKIVRLVCLILVLKVTTSLDVMNVQPTTARTTFCTAILAHLITTTYLAANSLPVPTMCQFLSTSIMGTIFAGHKINRTMATAKTTTVLGSALECTKGFSTIFTVQIYSSYEALICTLARTVMDVWRLLIEALTTYRASSICHLSTSPCKMALLRTKNVLGTLLCSGWCTLESLSAVSTDMDHGFTKGIYRALPGTVIDNPLICFEFSTTLEANLDH